MKNGVKIIFLCLLLFGVTPCRFRGYIFKNGSHRYLVHQSGLLQVLQGNIA
ncbi:hypothetical protein V6259_01115 [Marinomonas sp. TI.3.20]|uniref:hypothetical protein n=1 Tax=Marinomonas sp. TI.3.20 TaxID=3121296 RepID=UPI00311E6D4D